MLTIGALSTGLVAATLVGLGTLALARSSHLLAKRWFAIMCTAIALWVVANHMAEISPNSSLFWTRMTFFVVVIALQSFLLFVIEFPRPNKHLRRFNFFFVPFTLLTGVVTWLPEFIPAVVTIDAVSTVTTGALYPVFIAYLITILSFAFWVLIRRLHQEKRSERERIKFIIAGVSLMVLMGSVTNLILPLLTGTNPFARYGAYAAVLFVVPIAYAIVRHRLFDIRLLAARFLAYAGLVVVLEIIYGVLITLVTLLSVGYKLSAEQFLIVTSASVGLILAAQPLKRFFDKVTKAVFYQDAYETKEVLDAVSSILVRAVSVNDLTKESLGILADAVKAESAAVVLHGKKDDRMIVVGSKMPESSHVVIRDLLVRKSALTVSDDAAEGRYTGELSKAMSAAQIGVAMRLETSKEYLGLLLLGNKVTGNIYTSQDIGLVRTVAGELAVAVQNALRFEEIQDFNQTLQGRITEATAKLRETNKKLRALDEAKDEFISMASHQMRTPLTSVKGYISMILEGYGGPLKPDQRKLLSEAYNSSQRMVYLIADFLSVSRIRTDKFTIDRKPTRLTETIQDEINQLEITAKNRDLALVYVAPSQFPTLMLDEEKMRQVIMNLIDNAIYYTKPGGTITVTLSATDKEVSFKVQDTGIGVPKSEHHKLFGKFFRATNALRMRPDGTGIGLFLARKIIALQGGAMIFESKEGKGSTFGFRFPRRALSVDEAVDDPAHQNGDKH